MFQCSSNGSLKIKDEQKKISVLNIKIISKAKLFYNNIYYQP